MGTLTRPCPAGALISHDKLLLQLNPERELGDMSYKLGQVSASRWPAVSPGTPTHPRRCGGRAPSVKAESHHHQLISQRVEECRGGRAHRDPLEGLKWQEGGLSEDLWDLVKKT